MAHQHILPINFTNTALLLLDKLRNYSIDGKNNPAIGFVSLLKFCCPASNSAGWSDRVLWLL